MGTTLAAGERKWRIRLGLAPKRLLWSVPLGAAATLVMLLALDFSLRVAVICGVLLAAAAVFRLELGANMARLARIFWMVGAVLISYTMVEKLDGLEGWTIFTPVQIALNLLLYGLITALVWLITRRSVFSGQFILVFSWAVGMINRYVYAFRGRNIFPADLLTLQTAANVAGGYDYTPDRVQVGATLVLLGLLELSLALPREKWRRLSSRALGIGWGSCAVVVTLLCAGLLGRLGIEPSMWSTKGNGLLLNFTTCLQLIIPERPAGYDLQTVEDIAGATGEAELMAGGGAADGTQPVNLIVIMNESFSDLGVLGDMQTNQDCMPFVHSLTENTVKGTGYSSVFGGTTANSEYEFLTGNTTAFMPAGSVAYHMYVSQDDPSLVGQLGSLGYGDLAMHPYLASGWNRVEVYENFGFDRVMFTEDFESRRYCRYYVSDECDYNNLIAQYEAKGEGEPFFIFNVTMQNHSPYILEWDALERTVWLTGEMEGKYPDADQYLSLIYKSDQALKALIEYFSQVEEPTMVVMFGDHQPKVDNQFYVDLMGGELEELSLEEAMNKYKVPFLIWANYDIPEAQGVELSLNYLSTLVAQTANFPLTGYQRALTAFYQDLPIISAVGYRDGEGTWADRENELSPQAQEALYAYHVLEYNNVFDKENRLEGFFFLDT